MNISPIPRRSRGYLSAAAVIVTTIICVALTMAMLRFERAAREAASVDMFVIAANLARERVEDVVAGKLAHGYEWIESARFENDILSGRFALLDRDVIISEVARDDFITLQAGSGYKRVEVSVTWGKGPGERVVFSTVLSDY